MVHSPVVCDLDYGREGKFKDIFIATCYALRPYCILSLVAIALSNVLSQTEGDFYYVLTALALLWTVALLVAGLMQTHNYSAAKRCWLL